MVSGYLLVLNVRLRGRPFPGLFTYACFFFSLFSFFFFFGAEMVDPLVYLLFLTAIFINVSFTVQCEHA